MKKIGKYLGFSVGLLTLPMIVHGQGLENILETVLALIGTAVPIIIGLAVLYFLWGVLQYVVAKDPEAQKTARSVMIYGIIALFVMVSIWGLVAVLGATFGIDQGGAAGQVSDLVPKL